MITEKEAEERCKQFLQDYLKSAAPCSNEDVANMLMKLALMAGLTMYQIVGKEETFQRMIKTTAVACRMPVPNEVAVESRPTPKTKH